MDTIRKIWKTKWAKIGLIAVCVAAILAAAYALYPAEGQDGGSGSGVFFSGFSGNGARSGGGTAGAPASGGQGSGQDENADPNPLMMQAQRNAGLAAPEAAGGSGPVTPNPGATGGSGPGTANPGQQGGGQQGASPPGESQSGETPANPDRPDGENTPPAPPAAGPTCIFSIRCDTIFDNMDLFNKAKTSVLPKDGVVLKATEVTFDKGESVFDVLSRLTREQNIHMSSRFTPLYNSAYIEGINNIYESDCGPLSGWMYIVNGWFPNNGPSQYILEKGDIVEWVYTCDLGKDVGGGNATG